MARAIASRYRALPSRETNADAREKAFVTASLQTAEALVPQQKRVTLGRGWSRDVQTEAELRKALAVRRAAWKRLENGKRNVQLRRENRCANKKVRRVRTAAQDRFFERYIEGLEEEMRKHN